MQSRSRTQGFKQSFRKVRSFNNDVRNFLLVTQVTKNAGSNHFGLVSIVFKLVEGRWKPSISWKLTAGAKCSNETQKNDPWGY